jgi:hypothetical protein
MKLTRGLAVAAAKDAATRQMRKEGRTCWSDEDYNLACDTFNKLWPLKNDISQTEDNHAGSTPEGQTN